MARKYSRYKKLLPYPVMEGGGGFGKPMTPFTTNKVSGTGPTVGFSKVPNVPTSQPGSMTGAGLNVDFGGINAGMGIAGTAAGMIGNAIIENNAGDGAPPDKWGQALTYGATGAGLGASIGSAAGPIGTVAGGVVGGVVGGAYGLADGWVNQIKYEDIKEGNDVLEDIYKDKANKQRDTAAGYGGRYKDTNQMMMAAYGGGLPDGEGTDYFRTDKNAYVDSVVDARKDVGWLQRATLRNGPSIPTPKDVPGYKPGMTSTHLLSDDGKGYVYPRIVEKDGKLVDLGIEAQKYARETNTGIQFPQEQGSWFAADGYKEGTNILKDYAYGGPMQPQGQPMQNMQQLGQPQGPPQITEYGAGGQHGENPNGGVPVDAQGSPAATTGNKPVALTEEGEVSWKTKDGQTYVFSNKLTFA